MRARLSIIIGFALAAIPVSLALAQMSLPSNATSENVSTALASSGAVIAHDISVEMSAKVAGSQPSRARITTFVVRRPILVPADAGGYCIESRRVIYHDQQAADRAREYQRFALGLLVQHYQLCPGVQAPPGNPAAEAADYWRLVGEDLLPRPQPRIAPGYMLAGKLGYLEANSPSTARFEHDTPLGRLVISAQNTMWVDWGDGGGLTGPHEGPGGPWPQGKVTHSWPNATTYDVRVVQRWTATWELAGRNGKLFGLSTEGRIDDFEVRQLQAVRNI